MTPCSRTSSRLQLHAAEFMWAFLAPLTAMFILIDHIDHSALVISMGLYWMSSAFFTILACALLRLDRPVFWPLSSNDVKSVLRSGFLSVCPIYIIGLIAPDLKVPSPLLIIHAMVLVTGLLAIWLYSEASAVREGERSEDLRPSTLLLGVGRLRPQLLDGILAGCSAAHRIVGALDDDPKLIGRMVRQVPVLGPLSELDSVIDEFNIHGVQIERVLIGPKLNRDVPDAIRASCEARGVALAFAHEVWCTDPLGGCREGVCEARPYWPVKRAIDVVVSGIALVSLAPLIAAVAAAVFIKMGRPVFFWQQRLGLGSRQIIIYKFRTLMPPTDRAGRKLDNSQRRSGFGTFLRKFHLDELPQLWNVLTGEMSLIGPRPLLRVDQPADPTVRLSVRPGMTGWAQIRGGKLLSPEEKARLDEWYVQNASFPLDFQIAVATIRAILSGSSLDDWIGDAACLALTSRSNAACSSTPLSDTALRAHPGRS